MHISIYLIENCSYSSKLLQNLPAYRYKQLNEARSKILQGQEVVVNQLPNGAITISARQAAANTASSSSSQSTSTLTTLSSAPILQPPATSQAGLSTASVPARATAAKFPARPRARAKPAQRPSASVHSAPAPVDAAVLPAPLPCSLETFAAPLPVAPAIAPAPFHQSFVQALLDPSDTALEDPALPLSTAQLETVATRVGSPGTRLKMYASILFSILLITLMAEFLLISGCQQRRLIHFAICYFYNALNDTLGTR